MIKVTDDDITIIGPKGSVIQTFELIAGIPPNALYDCSGMRYGCNMSFHEVEVMIDSINKELAMTKAREKQ